jgi:hypothetical protein
MRGYGVQCRTMKVGEEADSIDGVWFGYEREVEEDDDADKQARTSATQRERRAHDSRGEAACGFGWTVPLRLAGEELGSRLLRPNGPNAEEGQQQAFGPKTEKRENFYFPFFFLIFLMHFPIVFVLLFFLK